jgi:hypothetical protein
LTRGRGGLKLAHPAMLFFKRILKEPEAGRKVARKERRGARRLPIGAEFPLHTVLGFDRRGGTIAPMSTPGGVAWKGRLLDVSEVGARILLPPAALASRGDSCELRLGLGGFMLTVPCEVTNLRVEGDGVHFGLRHDLANEDVRDGYRQLLEVVAFGATLRLQKKPAEDASGYLMEQYAGDGSRLAVWREKTTRTVSAFEFQLEDCLVRATKSRAAEHLIGGKTATPAKALEIQRLFAWVVRNLAPAVPDDVRGFLCRHAD